jgi:type IV pilus assembly protein PilQ
MNRLMMRVLLAFLAVVVLAGCAGPAQQARSSVEAAAVARVDSVSGQDLPDRVRVKIAGTSPLAFTVFRLSEPLRLIVDLADADVKGLGPEIPLSLGNVGAVRPIQFDEKAGKIGRLEIGLNESWEYVTAREGNSILIDFLKPAAKAEEKPVPAPAAPEATPMAKVADPGPEATPMARVADPAPAVAAEAAPQGAAEVAPTGVTPAPAEVPPAAAASPVAEVPVAPVVPPAEAAPAGATPAPAPLAPARFINRVSFIEERGGLTVQLLADGAIGNYDTLKIKAPNRLVLDVWGVAKGFKPTVIPVDSSGLKQIRVGDYPKEGKVRFVLDLSGAEFPAAEVRKLDGLLVVYLGQKDIPASVPPAGGTTAGKPAPAIPPPAVQGVAAAAPASEASTGLSVTDLSYQPGDKDGKVTLTGSGKLPYKVSQPDSSHLVLELPGVVLPKKLVRSIDTREKGGALASLAAFNPRDNGGARVTLAFAADTVFDVSQQDAVIAVTLTAPARAEAAPKSAAEVTPAGVTAPAALAVVTPTGVSEAAPQVAAEAAPAAAPAVVTEKPLPAAADKKVALSAAKTGSYAGERVTLDFQDADVKNVLRLIAEVSGLNIITSDQVGGTISMRMVDVPWDQALEVILKTKGLGMVREGNVVRIASIGQLDAEQADILKNREMSRKVEDLSLKIIGLSYAKGEEVLPQLTPFLSERGSINVDKRTNSLIIKDLVPNIESVQKLIVELDIPTPQVRIEARVVIVDETFSRSLGIKWGGSYVAGDTTIAGTEAGSYLVNLPSTSVYGGIGVTIGSVGNFQNLDLRLSAMENNGNGKIISSPSLLVVENQQANIEVNNPFPEDRTSTTTGANGQTNTSSVTFSDLWTKLKITPHVTANKDIFMDVYVEKDSKGDTVPLSTGTFTGVNTHSLTTKIVVKNHGTAVIGGLFTESNKDSKGGIPFLSKIPVLGYLFRNTTESKTREEMLIFINAAVMEN